MTSLHSIVRCVTVVLGMLMASHPASGQGGPKRTVLVVGDSMIKLVAASLAKELAVHPEIEVVPQVRIGSGLARLDLYDWHAALQQLAPIKPEVAVVMFGGNDGQPMKTAGGLVEPGTPGWAAEYGRRVERTISILQGIGVRKIIWVGLPDMREPRLEKMSKDVNGIVSAQAQGKANVAFFETALMFSVEPGKFSPYILGPKGRPILVRSSDGGHLNTTGADLLASRLAAPLVQALGLSSVP